MRCVCEDCAIGLIVEVIDTLDPGAADRADWCPSWGLLEWLELLVQTARRVAPVQGAQPEVVYKDDEPHGVPSGGSPKVKPVLEA